MDCKNCGHHLDGKYCIVCGQEAKTKRINFRYILDEIQNSVFQIDHGFFYTVKELLVRPGNTLREFMEGKRKKHFKPLAFLLLVSTLYAFAKYFIGYGIVNYHVNVEEKGVSEKVNNIINWIAENESYVLLLSMPFYSLASYLAFLRSKYNYFEHFVLNVYITGLVTFINIFISLTLSWSPIVVFLSIGLSLFYNVWTYIQFFNDKKLIVKLSLILLTYVILISLFIIALIVFVLIYVLTEGVTS